MNRRSFIKSTGIASLGLSLKIDKTFSQSDNSSVDPLVIATWDVKKATKKAWEIISSNGNSLDAIEQGCMIEEANKDGQSVGIGGLPDREGNVTLDACIMDHYGNCGSVVYLKDIKHAISVARMVMEKTPHVMLVSDGALQFAKELGFPEENLLVKQSKEEWVDWKKKSKYRPVVNIENHDTIGQISLDRMGHLAGFCTTSGMSYKMHGRVGDSPIIGAGLYVDGDIGAATATGHGEEVIRTVGSYKVVSEMERGLSPQMACEEAVRKIFNFFERRKQNVDDTQIGFIAMNKMGEIGSFSLRPGFQYAVCRKGKPAELIDSPYLFK